MEKPSATDLASHFEFGRNWSSYAALIDETRIDEAARGLEHLVHRDEIAGKSFIDIGCGSGLHSLAALRLGAARVLAVDLDPHSVATTRETLARFAPTAAWEAREASVFDLDPKVLGTFDVVYSWGVLHHTGAMYPAIRHAAVLTAPEGILAVALYRKTRLCPLWKIEKKLYCLAPRFGQRLLRGLFVLAMRVGYFATGRDFRAFRASYGSGLRGMDFDHDIHDWLGGYPYESISPDEAHALCHELGMQPLREFARPHQEWGVFGSGNDEYVWRAAASRPNATVPSLSDSILSDRKP